MSAVSDDHGPENQVVKETHESLWETLTGQTRNGSHWQCRRPYPQTLGPDPLRRIREALSIQILPKILGDSDLKSE